MEPRLDPEKVREARAWLENFAGLNDASNPLVIHPEAQASIRRRIDLLLAVLSEGREASAPFARFFKGPDHDLSPATDTTPLVTFQDQDGHALADLWMGDLRRLAAFHNIVTEERGDG